MTAGVVLLARTGPTATPSRRAPAPCRRSLPTRASRHVHGLGVDPADGALYAATHFGLFRLPADGSGGTRVADRYQDTMGSTFVGPGTVLGSGHPDAREDHPPRLGLIESTDAGERWRPLSLRGEADSHALHAAHGSVYGYEAGSGQSMVSSDRQRWETRSELPMRDSAVSPDDPAAVLATTEQGLARSTDGGRHLAGGRGTTAGRPELGAPTAYGVGPDGTDQHSADGGAGWTARGTAGGPPEAVAVDSTAGEEVLDARVSGRGILQSTDGGRSSTNRYAA